MDTPEEEYIYQFSQVIKRSETWQGPQIHVQAAYTNCVTAEAESWVWVRCHPIFEAHCCPSSSGGPPLIHGICCNYSYWPSPIHRNPCLRREAKGCPLKSCPISTQLLAIWGRWTHQFNDIVAFGGGHGKDLFACHWYNLHDESLSVRWANVTARVKTQRTFCSSGTFCRAAARMLAADWAFLAWAVIYQTKGFIGK